MEIEVISVKGGNKTSTKLVDLTASSRISDVKLSYQRIKPGLYPDRQSYKLDPKGKSLKDSDTLDGIGLSKGGKLYFKDKGPQVGWSTVFLTEYAGPLVIYLLFYSRPAIIYGASEVAGSQRHLAVQLGCICWTFHYTKRLLETIFVHRFSHSTMPIMNIFKNSVYYWGFAAFVAYFNNHPLYTPPAFGLGQIYGGLTGFVFCELGNFSIHMALRNLRPAGTTERRIPRPTGNPLTDLFGLVSCPNYTYELGSWLSYSIMTQSLPALIFTIAGFCPMALWALGKHKNYKQEFKDYPRNRKALIPFIL